MNALSRSDPFTALDLHRQTHTQGTEGAFGMTTRTDSDFDRSARAPRRRKRDAARSGGPGKRAEDAITNLSAYALGLDLEYHQVSGRLLELLKGDVAADELRTLVRERDELEAAREAFRRSVAELHDLTTREAGQAAPDQP